MKKYILSIIIITSMLGLSACGKYKPNISELNTMYRTTEYKAADGSYPTIIIKSVELKGKDIIVKTASPFEQIKYDLDNFLSVTLVNEKGDTEDNVKINITEEDEQAVLKITGNDDLSEYKYIKIYPYDNDGNPIEFNITK